MTVWLAAWDNHGVTLAREFLAHLSRIRPSPPDVPRLEILEAALVQRLAQGRTKWPGVTVPDEVFVHWLAERLPESTTVIEALDTLETEDLFLACGCTRGDPAALAAFESHFMSQIAAYLSRQGTSPQANDEIKQILRTRLLVSDGLKPARVSSYTGRGPLGAWLRSVTVRAAIDLQRVRDPSTPGSGRDPILRSAAPDPELGYLRTKFAAEFGAAFEQTLQGLSTREGNILRLYFLEAMPAPSIGTLYQVSPRTVQRWIVEIRQKILDGTYCRLRETLKLSTTELGALLSVVESQVDVSITRHLTRSDREPS